MLGLWPKGIFKKGRSLLLNTGQRIVYSICGYMALFHIIIHMKFMC